MIFRMICIALYGKIKIIIFLEKFICNMNTKTDKTTNQLESEAKK